MLIKNLKFAFKQLFSHFFLNTLSLIFIFLFGALSLRTIILIPVALLVSQSVLIQITEKGFVDFKSILADLDLTLDRYFQVMLATIIVIILVLAGFSLFIIPGLIAIYTLQPVVYLLTKNSKIKANESLLLSYKMMKGNRFKLWVYDLVALLIPSLTIVVSLIFIRQSNLIDLTQLPHYYNGIRLMPMRPMFNSNIGWMSLIFIVTSFINGVWLNIISIAKIKFFASIVKKNVN